MKRQLIRTLLQSDEPHLANAVAYQARAATTPLPDRFHDNEPGLMTVKEFIQFRNPQGKRHSEDSYETTVKRMNQDYSLGLVGHAGRQSEGYAVYENKRGIVVKHDGNVVGVIHNRTLYHQKDVRLPEWFRRERANSGERFDVKQKKAVKYPAEYVKLVSDVARDNLKKYPVLMQNLLNQGETFQVRAEKKLVTDKGTTIVILNSAGLEVGSATDEWGATLFMVAQEYQRRGFGKLLAKFWYRWNPTFGSGGFTPQGERNAIRAWGERVHEFLSRGWYSQLVRDGRLTKQRVDLILKDVSKRPPARQAAPKVKPQPLVMIDFPMFVVYDRAFYDSKDEKHVYGYGFYRDSDHVGDFLYRIEHERKWAELTTRVALHVGHAEGIEKIYVGKGYGDLIEHKGLTEQVGDYVATKGDARVDKVAKLERQIRRKLDPYQETYSLLLEAAEFKDW